MIICTVDTVEGYEIEQVLGLVKGSASKARHVGRDIVAAFRNFFGGEVKEYTELISQTRDLAMQRMINEARNLNADAIVAVRFVSTQVMQGVAEIFVYGTAVKLKSKQQI